MKTLGRDMIDVDLTGVRHAGQGGDPVLAGFGPGASRTESIVVLETLFERAIHVPDV